MASAAAACCRLGQDDRRVVRLVKFDWKRRGDCRDAGQQAVVASFPLPGNAYASGFTGWESAIQGELKPAVVSPPALHPSVRETGALDRRHTAAKLVLYPHLAYIVCRAMVGHLEC